MRKKVAVFHNIIAPYRFPLFESISKNSKLDVTIVFMAITAKNRKWNLSTYLKNIHFPYKILPHFTLTIPLKERIEYIINPTIFLELIRGKYDLIITAGWLDFSCQMIYLLAPLFKYKYIIWSESTRNEKSFQRAITLPFVKWAIKNASGYIAIGTASRQYLIDLGAEPSKVQIAYSTVDIDHFRKKSCISEEEKSKLKKRIGVRADRKLLLYVGQFIHRKGVDILLEAYRKLDQKKYSLILLGYGEEERTYREYIKSYSLRNVVIINHVEVDEMPKYYAIADLFILPSREETWGLVVNEALASGLPVVASHRVGSAVDLINSRTGKVFQSEDSEELKEHISQYASNSKNITKASLKVFMDQYSPQKAAEAFFSVIYSVS